VTRTSLQHVLATRRAPFLIALRTSDTELGFADRTDRIAVLRPLVHADTSGLDHPLTGAEREALPWAIARQPLWGIGGWVAVLDDQNTARAHARATSPPSSAPFSWSPTSAPDRAPNAQIRIFS
jgi:hypothetical protein